MLTLKKSISISLLFMLILCFVSCASTNTTPTGIATDKNAPLWLTDIHATLPEDDFLCAVGYATDRTTAEALAVSNLTKILKQRVEAEILVNQSFQNNLTEQDRTIESSVKTSSLIDEIIGIKIHETWVAKDKTVYSLASLSKEDVGSHYYQIIKQKEKAIINYLTILIENPVTFTGIGACLSALELAYENDSYLELLSVINYDMYKSIDLEYESSSEIEVLLQMQNALIFIGVFVDGDLENRISSSFATSLNEMGFNTEKLASIPVNNPPPYILDVKLTFETLPKSNQSKNTTVLFTLEANLKDSKGKTILPWNFVGKEAHLSESQAKTRAIYTIEQEIKKEYLSLLQKIGENN